MAGLRRATRGITKDGLILTVSSIAAAGLIAAAALPAAADDVKFVVTVPPGTPPGDFVYVSGDFQGWDPGHPAYRLRRLDDERWTITLPLPDGEEIEFKFTRGTWATVEKGPQGEELASRKLIARDGDEASFAVANWADLGPEPPPAPRTLTGDVFTMSFPEFLDGRRVWVYLPPGYGEDPARRYPVLYFWDGQNVFDASTSVAGEWEADETLERLIAAGQIRPLIAVGIDNGKDARMREYTPWAAAGRGGGGGAGHLRAVIEVLKPRIDALLRTLPGPEDTGLCGSSLGGLMTAYAAWAAPETFGRAAALSVSFDWADGRLTEWAAGRDKPAVRLYFDTGTEEGRRFTDHDGNGVDDPVDDLRRLRDVALAQGFREGDDLMAIVEEGGQHHESAWARRLPAVLEFLFPASE